MFHIFISIVIIADGETPAPKRRKKRSKLKKSPKGENVVTHTYIRTYAICTNLNLSQWWSSTSLLVGICIVTLIFQRDRSINT